MAKQIKVLDKSNKENLNINIVLKEDEDECDLDFAALSKELFTDSNEPQIKAKDSSEKMNNLLNYV